VQLNFFPTLNNDKLLSVFVLTFRSLSSATPASNVSLPSSSTVTAASFDKVKPDANGCPELLREEKNTKETEYIQNKKKDNCH
jgi:hypothetical protein